MVNTNQKPVRDTQKIKRNANITLKKAIKSKGKRQERKKQRRTIKTTRKQLTKWQ